MKAQVFIKAENLPPPKGLFAKKTPSSFALVSLVTGVGTVMGIKRHRVGATEVILSNSSPEWVTIVEVDYQTEQRFAVDVFHTSKQQVVDDHEIHDKRYQGKEHRGTPIPKDSQPLTGLIFSMDEILQSPQSSLTMKIPGTSIGTLTVGMELMREGYDDDSFLRFHIRGYSFPSTRRNFLERPDFFYEIYRKTNAPVEPQWVIVYKSKPEKGTLSPMWSVEDISLDVLCNQDLNRELCIRVVDMDAMGKRNVLGWIETNVHGLMGAVSIGGNADTTKAIPLMCKDGVKTLGQLIVLQAEITVGQQESAAVAFPVTAEDVSPVEIMRPPSVSAELYPAPTVRGVSSSSSFQEYARRCPIDLCMAIDFSTANGDYRSPDSAHYRSSGSLNDYAWAMSVVGATLAKVNPTQEYPMWGFGGSFQNKTHQIFQCGATPKANGVKGMLEAYRTTFETGMTQAAPRKLDNILMAGAHHAKKQLDLARKQQSLSYSLLVILTVGDDPDLLMAAKEKLVSMQGAPLSVLVIPIRHVMNDEKLLIYLQNRKCRRFVNCLDYSISDRDAMKLSTKVMQVLHGQMPAYFHSQGIAP